MNYIPDNKDALDELRALGEYGTPRTSKELKRRLENIADKLDMSVKRARWLVGALVVSQMLPPNVLIKGGFGITLRVGDSTSRATQDLDLVSQDPDALLDALNQSLKQGFGVIPAKKTGKKNRIAFSGEAKHKEKGFPKV